LQDGRCQTRGDSEEFYMPGPQTRSVKSKQAPLKGAVMAVGENGVIAEDQEIRAEPWRSKSLSSRAQICFVMV
jgi:hypothetical protein